MSQISAVHVAAEQLLIYRRTTTAVLFDRPGPIRSDRVPVIPNAPMRLLAVFLFDRCSGLRPVLSDPVCDKATTVHKVPTYVKKMWFGA